MPYYRDINRRKPTRTIVGCETEVWDRGGFAEIVVRLPLERAQFLLDEAIRTGRNISTELLVDGRNVNVEVFAARMDSIDHTRLPMPEPINKTLVDILGVRTVR